MKNLRKQQLREAYTISTCAAAASKAAAYMLINKRRMYTVDVTSSSGTNILLSTDDIHIMTNWASCAVKKSSIDDPNLTHDVLIYSRAELCDAGISIEGGKGVGRAAAEGMGVPVGTPVIEDEPRMLIKQCVQQVFDDYGYEGGVKITIFIPSGEAIAKRYKNLYKGYTGGMPILGGTAPEQNDTRRVKTNLKRSIEGNLNNSIDKMVFTLGSYGIVYSRDTLKLPKEMVILTDNYIGDAIDYAVELGVKGILVVGHIGKMVKMAAGIMNTRSHNSDGRLEILCASAIKAGVSVSLINNLVSCFSIDEALDMLKNDRTLDKTMLILRDKIQHNLDKRSGNYMNIDFIAFSDKYGEICKSAHADEIVAGITKAGCSD